MTLRSTAATLILLAGTTVWAQSAESAAAPTPLPMQQPGFASRRLPGMTPGARTSKMETITPRQRLQDLEETVKNMHALLKQMDAKAAAKDSLAKQNLQMWELLVTHLDKQLRDLRIATAAHEDMENRRAALYKQADEKAAAAAQAARAAAASKMATPESAASGTATPSAPAPASATPSSPAPAATAPAAGSTASPN